MPKKYTRKYDGVEYEYEYYSDDELNKKYAPFIYGFIIICVLITVALEIF